MGFAAAAAVTRAALRPRGFWKAALECAVFLAVLTLVPWLLYGIDCIGAAGIGYFLSWAWFCLVRQKQADRRSAEIWKAQPYRLTVDDQGLLAASDGGSYWRTWKRVSQILEREEWIAIAFDGLETLAIPQVAFQDTDTRTAWLSYVRDRVAEAQGA